MNEYKRIAILGGGVAALACARSLADAGIPFTMIAETLGGRIVPSSNGEVQYGAYYVTADYQHVLPFCDRLERIPPLQIALRRDGKTLRLVSPSLFPLSGEGMRYLAQLHRFRRHYQHFKLASLEMGQRTAMESDPWLLELFRSPADIWAKRSGFERWAKVIGSVARASTFLPPTQLTAFDFLQVTLNLLVPCYRFKFNLQRLIAPFAERIVEDKVLKIRKRSHDYTIETKSGKAIEADLLVVALGEQVHSIAGLGLTAAGLPVTANMVHIAGEPLPLWRRYSHWIFPTDENSITLARAADGTYLYYSREPVANLESFFPRCDIIHRAEWNPAFRLGVRPLRDQRASPSLFYAGDFNVVGLEDAFITGLHAAKAIAKEFSKNDQQPKDRASA